MSRAPAPFYEPQFGPGLRTLAPLSVMAGSLITILPFVARFPVLPPFGLMLLLAWRLRRPDALRIWTPLLLGFFDDLVSGQPLGSAMVLWTLCFFSIDIIERRVMVYRDFWQDWLIAAGGILTCLFVGRLIATPLTAHVDTFLLIQSAIAILLYPVAATLVGLLDPGREPE